MSSTDLPRAAHAWSLSSPPARYPSQSTRRPTNPAFHTKSQSDSINPCSIRPLPSSATSSSSTSTTNPLLPHTIPALPSKHSDLSVSLISSFPHHSLFQLHSPTQKSGMYSTPEERSPSRLNSSFRVTDQSSSRPTIEQIAMGLHVSRTPHLRPLGSSRYTYSQRSAPHSTASAPHHRPPSSPVTLPPPPARSSLKKPSTGSSTSSPALSPHFSPSASSTTVTSMTPSAQSPRSPLSLKARMARLLHGSKSALAPTTAQSTPRDSINLAMPKKAVRFTTEDVDNESTCSGPGT
ncbi:hypothetical protein BDQ17DRAFT_1352697 [Cyathus striatus]|nr:hypothetical protein BDQ17DRAFT_1352697 [Cyathus striatus]